MYLNIKILIPASRDQYFPLKDSHRKWLFHQDWFW